MTGEPELLDIAQAAALLQVSQASLRRWTNRGLLHCLRIGGRRERRFRRADLMAFVEGRTSATPGGHLCGFYTTDAALVRHAARLLSDGLARGSVCLLAAEPDVRKRVLAQLARGEAERIVVTAYAIRAALQLKYWRTQFAAAMRTGAPSIQVVGDVSGGRLARGATWDDVLAYEAAYGKLSREFPVATACLYDARTHSGLETTGVLALHPDLFRHPVARFVS